jgi:hypothetical protein
MCLFKRGDAVPTVQSTDLRNRDNPSSGGCLDGPGSALSFCSASACGAVVVINGALEVFSIDTVR